MGWQFTAAEWIGGVVLIAIISLLVKVTYPKELVERARTHQETGSGHEHGGETVEGATLWQKLRNPRTPILVAQSVAMEYLNRRHSMDMTGHHEHAEMEGHGHGGAVVGQVP